MKILLFILSAGFAFAQTVERPKVPSASTLNSPTSQIKAWYLYAVSCEEEIARLKGSPTFSGIDVIKVTLIAPKTDLRIEWDYVNQGQTGFTVERSTNGTTFTTLATLADPAARAYTDKGLAAGSYWYRVRAYKPAEISAPSNVATGAIP